MMIIIIVIIAILLAVYIAVVFSIFRIATVRTAEKTASKKAAWGSFIDQINSGIAWITEKNCEKIEIMSYDGLKLAARLLPAENARGTIILMHGYRAPLYRDFACVYEYFNSLGFNLLIPSQRAHGESEGKYICYGAKERYDCQKWVEYVYHRFGAGSDIFLDGLSMGCATVLMASNLDLPDNVRGIFADCGFTSAWDEIAYLLKRYAHLPAHPILDGVNLLTKLFADFALDECSAADCVAETNIPILFVHGTADTFVPCEFGKANFNACSSEKKLVLVDGAAHGVSYLIDREGCQREIEAFIERYSTCEK